MKKRVHGFFRHDSVLRKLIIFLRLKAHVKGLQITVFVPALALDNLIELPCQRKRFLVPGSVIIGRKGINGKGLIVGVLGGVLRLSVKGKRPVNAPVFLIHTVIPQEAERMLRVRKQVLLLQNQVSVGEKPEDSAV